jgi:hypothetical protein
LVCAIGGAGQDESIYPALDCRIEGHFDRTVGQIAPPCKGQRE